MFEYVAKLAPVKLAAIAATASIIVLTARAITAVRGIFLVAEPKPGTRIYFANHASHGDFVLVWTVLPPALRKRTRPVAAAEYWTSSALRRFIGRSVFNAVLIDRDPKHDARCAIASMANALEQGDSLIIFPEGTRNVSEDALLPFRSGLYHLARAQPHVDLVPVWIDNLNRVMPKGRLLPVPIICSVTFGAPLRVETSENRQAFLERARSALLATAPQSEDR